MKWLLLIVGASAIVGSSGAAYMASTRGWGLPGLLDEPVSVRAESVRGASGSSGPYFLYFGSRRHVGGGYGYGK